MVSKFEIEGVATFLIILGDCMNIFFVLKVKILVPMKWSYGPPLSSILTIKLRIVNVFCTYSPISFEYM